MKGKQITSMVLGILSICWGCAGTTIFGGIIGLALGIVAIILSSGVKNAGAENGMSKAGFICGLIGTILSAVTLIIGIACVGCVACAGLSS